MAILGTFLAVIFSLSLFTLSGCSKNNGDIVRTDKEFFLSEYRKPNVLYLQFKNLYEGEKVQKIRVKIEYTSRGEHGIEVYGSPNTWVPTGRKNIITTVVSDKNNELILEIETEKNSTYGGLQSGDYCFKPSGYAEIKNIELTYIENDAGVEIYSKEKEYPPFVPVA